MEEIGKYGRTDIRCHKNIKAMAAEGQDVLGIYIGIPTPYMAELAALAGFDYIMLDMEHNIYNPETVCDMVRAADACGIAVAARIAQTSLMLPALDFGMIGMKVPHVHSAKQVQELVNICKFAPLGIRGFSGGARAQRYSLMPIVDYKKEADDEVFLMVMIEDKEGIDHMEEIIAVPGLDYVAIGPGDVSQALGLFGQTDHPEVKAVIDRVQKTADKYGVRYPESGAPLIIADDRGIVLNALRDRVKYFRENAAGKTAK
jgi:4-hydroxy-2-oxoheptanedioate aldolase